MWQIQLFDLQRKYIMSIHCLDTVKTLIFFYTAKRISQVITSVPIAIATTSSASVALHWAGLIRTVLMAHSSFPTPYLGRSGDTLSLIPNITGTVPSAISHLSLENSSNSS